MPRILARGACQSLNTIMGLRVWMQILGETILGAGKGTM